MNTSSSIDPADEPLSSAETRTLQTGYLVQRRLPVNFQPADADLFSHELEREIPSTGLLEMRNVRVSPEGILFKGARISGESFAFPWMWEEWRIRTLAKFLAQNYLGRKHSRFEKDAVWIVDNWSHGYFHWMADALTRLFAMRDCLRDLVLLLPHRYKELEFIHPSLKPFDLGGVEFMEQNEVQLCRRILVPTHTAPSGHYNEEIIRGVRDLMVDFYGQRIRKADGRVYISRGRATRRTIVNEPEVIDVMREFDFEIVCAEHLSFAEQVKMFSGARHLVSNHGAGLTNMLYMPPGSSVLELRHRTDSINNSYFTLASALALNYFYQSCDPVNPGHDSHLANLKVDTKALRTNLILMLECNLEERPNADPIFR